MEEKKCKNCWKVTMLLKNASYCFECIHLAMTYWRAKYPDGNILEAAAYCGALMGEEVV